MVAITIGIEYRYRGVICSGIFPSRQVPNTFNSSPWGIILIQECRSIATSIIAVYKKSNFLGIGQNSSLRPLFTKLSLLTTSHPFNLLLQRALESSDLSLGLHLAPTSKTMANVQRSHDTSLITPLNARECVGMSWLFVAAIVELAVPLDDFRVAASDERSRVVAPCPVAVVT